MSNFFLKIFNFFQRRKLFLWLLLTVIIVLLGFSALRISFVEDISSFLPNNSDNKRINEAYQHIGAANKIIVRFAKSDMRQSQIDDDLLTDAATRFAEILQKNDSAGHIKELMYEIDNDKISNVTNFITQNIPYFLEEEDFVRIDTLIQLQSIENTLNTDNELLMSPMGGFVRNVILNDPLHFSQNALKNLEVFKLNDNTNTYNGFIFNNNGECLVTITSKYPVSETANNKLLAKEIYSAINQTATEFNNEIKIVPFGAALISITNADQIKNDSILSVSIALVLILALLFYFFRNVKSLFFIALSVIFGALFSLGVIVLFKSTVSIIAIGIASIIFGIAINYPLHFLAHFRHNPNIRQTIKEIVNPLLIGNITTVGAFLSLLFISSDAMKDLGLFSSFLLVGTIGFVLVFLPHFLGEKKVKEVKELKFGKIAEFSPENNKFIVLTFLVFTVVLFFFSFGTKFETNLQSINYMTAEQRAEMNKLIEENKGKGQTLYVVAEGKSVDDALINYNFVLRDLKFLKENQPNYIKSDAGIGNFFPSKEVQQNKIIRWNRFWADKKDVFISMFNTVAKKQGFNQGVFDDFIDHLNIDFKPQNFDYFQPIFHGLGENYFSIQEDKTLIYTILNCDEREKQTVENKITEANSHVFVFDNTSLAQKMIDALSGDFNNVLYICGLIVFAFLLFSFGRIELAILTFLPMAVGWIWILGLMNIFDLKFNIVNIILATFIFGQGDDYTIFVTEGLIYEYAYRKKMLASFKNSIILSATILFIAIGMLIFAKHPAMRSLAELTIVGMISVVLCAYLFPPLIFKWLVYNKGKNRLLPITLWNWLKTIFSFFIFLICSIIITLCGFFILTIGGKSKKNKLLYHKLLCYGFRFLAHCLPQVKHKVHNISSETFETPAIIICNHQSHLDLLYTLMLSPKIVALTNKWVWNSPFYDWIIRYADFLPVVDSIEQYSDKLGKLIAEGYSVLVFPEGTRSEDCSMNRFHQGAFYLAEKYALDILPVVIHGVGHFLPKTEFLLRKGEVNVKILERVSLDHPLRKNESLLSVAKSFKNMYKSEYQILVNQIETTDYFADKIRLNYIYKGKNIAQQAKNKLKYFDNFRQIMEYIPNTGELCVINGGQGEFPLMCSLVKKQLSVTAIQEDEELFNIAANCISIPYNLNYSKKNSNFGLYNFFVIFNPERNQLDEYKDLKTNILVVTTSNKTEVTNFKLVKQTDKFTLFFKE
jgi:1-acyl-sn-glycerol-3-phosphate acyltransferase